MKIGLLVRYLNVKSYRVYSSIGRNADTYSKPFETRGVSKSSHACATCPQNRRAMDLIFYEPKWSGENVSRNLKQSVILNRIFVTITANKKVNVRDLI